MKTLQVIEREIPETLVDKLEVFLGTQGIHFLHSFNQICESTSHVGKLHESRKCIPVQETRSAHSPEGMEIRAFMRKQRECINWTCHDFDNNWSVAIDTIISRHKRQLSQYS